MVEEMARLSYDPEKLNRLVTVLEDELGHDLAFAVESGKIAANIGGEQSRIALDQIERRLSCILTTEDLALILAPMAQKLRAGAQETVQLAGLGAASVERVIYVGGSSLMSIVSETMKTQFPDARHSFTEVFTAVADGLAIASARY